MHHYLKKVSRMYGSNSFLAARCSKINMTAFKTLCISVFSHASGNKIARKVMMWCKFDACWFMMFVITLIFCNEIKFIFPMISTKALRNLLVLLWCCYESFSSSLGRHFGRIFWDIMTKLRNKSVWPGKNPKMINAGPTFIPKSRVDDKIRAFCRAKIS